MPPGLLSRRLKLLEDRGVVTRRHYSSHPPRADYALTVALAGQPTRWVGHDGQLLGGMAASLMMFPEHGIVVSVISNTSYADTESLGLSIAQAFAAQGNSPARK